MSQTTEIHGKEVECRKCGLEQITTVTIHNPSEVAGFECARCGKMQSP